MGNGRNAKDLDARRIGVKSLELNKAALFRSGLERRLGQFEEDGDI